MALDLSTTDYFSDDSLIQDPYPYYEFAREQGPVWCEPVRGAFVVTGYEELCTIFRDLDAYSSCNGFAGPFHELPKEPGSDDLTGLINKHRDKFAFHENLVTFDPPTHTAHRGLMMRLLTPKRLQENEEFMWRLADDQIDGFAAAERCDFVADYAQPFSLLVIADLLGVPEEDRPLLRQRILANSPAGSIGQPPPANPLAYLEEFFIPYVEARRQGPRDDVLTQMARATFPDGTMPEVIEVVRAAVILFAGGQGTSARFQVGILQLLAEQPELQRELRRDPGRIPDFVEEALRWSSPTKISFRMARKTTTLAGVQIPAGGTLMLMLSAADRDPRRFECPAEFRVDRPDSRQHIAFGRGVHSCPGGPLARAEGRITTERILARLDDIRVSEAEHGRPDARRWSYTPSYILRGLEALHLEFTTSRSL